MSNLLCDKIFFSVIVFFISRIVSIVKFSDFRPVQQTFRDDKGYEHVSLYDAEKANEKYKAEKNND